MSNRLSEKKDTLWSSEWTNWLQLAREHSSIHKARQASSRHIKGCQKDKATFPTRHKLMFVVVDICLLSNTI